MYYPMMLNLKGKNVVIVGGGRVAYQKLKGLENTKANIKIISPNISPNIEQWLKLHNAEWIRKEYEPSDIKNADLIFAATNNPVVNNEIRQHKENHQLFLQVDNPEVSDFISPAVLRRGKLSIAISTNGASPALAKKLKKELEDKFEVGFADYLQFLEDSRKIILEQNLNASIKNDYLNRLLDPIFYQLTIEGKVVERDQLLHRLITEGTYDYR